MQLHIARTFKLFVNHVIHTAAGFYQRGSNNGERTAFLNVARRTEEAFGTVQRIGIYTAGQDFAGSGYNGVVGAGEAGNRVEQDDYVFFVFYHALGFFNHHFSHLDVALRRFVEGRGDDFAAHGAAHFGNFFRAFIN